MSQRKTRILVVDDSAFIRKALEMMLKEEPSFEVVGMAKNGREGVEMAKKYNPDVITMDVEMPVMDGLTALKHIMEANPKPVIMISSLTEEGADTTIKALELGAVDFIPKKFNYSSAEIVKIKEELFTKIKNLHGVNVDVKNSSNEPAPSRLEEKIREKEYAITATEIDKEKLKYDIIVIASSTGGPMALQKIILKLPENLPVPIVIAQHMPPLFTRSLARRLKDLSKLDVMEAEEHMVPEAGKVYLARGGQHLILKKKNSLVGFKYVKDKEGYLYKPSGDLLFDSAAEIYGERAIGVILTGMGKDGAQGLKTLHDKGAYTIAESENSCVIFGMPRAAIELGAVKSTLEVSKIADKLMLLLHS
ncbi:MAG: chemotaxis response regulator protein-glutamate methylesterase [Calditrichia bacterium]